MIIIRELLAAAVLYLVCYSVGRCVAQWARLRLSTPEALLLNFLLGCPILSLGIFFLCAAGVLYRGTLFSLPLVLLLFAKLQTREPESATTRSVFRDNRIFFSIGSACYLIFGFIYLLHALAPEVSPDGTNYHVALPFHYLLQHGFNGVYETVFTGMPHAIEMLYVLAFAIGLHSAPALCHLLFLLAIPPALATLAARHGSPRAGLVGGLLFYLSPVVGMDGSSPYNDVAVAAVAVASILLLDRWLEEPSHKTLVLIGALAGFGFTCKYPFAFFAIAVGLTVLIYCVRHRLPVFRTVGLFCLAVAVPAAPWVVRNSIHYGNPVFPFLSKWFESRFFYPMVEADYLRFQAHIGGVSWPQIPAQLLWGGRLVGVLGPIFLLAPLALLSLTTRLGRLCAVGFIGLALPYYANTTTRFLIPALPMLCLMIGIGMLRVPRVGAGVAVASIVLSAAFSWPSAIPRWAPHDYWHLELVSLRDALRLDPNLTYLRKHYADYDACLMLDKYVPVKDKVFALGFAGQSYHHRTIVGPWDSALGKRLWETFTLPMQSFGSTYPKRTWRFAPVQTREIRVATAVKDEGDSRIAELRFYNGAKEISRNREWNLRSSVNPWEVGLMFDGSLYSWWTTGRSTVPGQWVEIDFGQSEAVDRVEMIQSPGQTWHDFAVAINDGRAWRSVAAHQERTEFMPSRSARRAAALEMERLGVRWILSLDDAYGAQDLLENAEWWGTVQVASAGRFRLWRLSQ